MRELGYDHTTVAVTGAASGIGEATAQLLSQLGATVVGLDINRPSVSLDRFVQVDLRDEGSITHAAEAIGAPLAGLFHCAGLPQTAPGLDVFLAGFVGPRELTERLMAKFAPGAGIVCVASTAGFAWRQDLGRIKDLLAQRTFAEARDWCAAHLGADADNYSLTKAAVSAYVADRGVEIAPRGIRINCVSPGPTETPMTEAFRNAHPDAMARLAIPLGRTAQPDEQAWAFAFLGSPRASFITGSTIYVDGGYVAALTMGRISR